MQTSLHIRQATVRYRNGHTALDNVNIELQGGTICALLGVNGSGKSTLFKSIMGLLKLTTGEIRLCNLPIQQALKRNIVAYVPQTEEIDWQFPISVYDVVMMGRYGQMNFLRRPSAEDKQIVTEAMKRVGIAHLATRQIGELSGGQKKRVFLARAIAQKSQIILLDEPFTGVDIETEKSIMALLQQLKDEGHLIVVATHHLATVPDFCDHCIMLFRTVQFAGSITDTFTRENLEKVFGTRPYIPAIDEVK